MRKALVFLAACVAVALAQPQAADPCADPLYLALKKKDINSLTQREYDFLMLTQKGCLERQAAAAAQTPGAVGTGQAVEAPPAPECAPVIVVVPGFKAEQLGGTFQQEELTRADGMVADAVSGAYDRTSWFLPSQAQSYSKCVDSRAVVVRLVSYYLQEESVGLHKGVMTLEVALYERLAATAPSWRFTVTDEGKVAWGDSKPFAWAVEAVCKKIRRRMKRR